MSPSFGAEGDFHRALTAVLAQMRSDAAISQGVLAAELGIDQATVSRVEANQRRLTAGETFAWCEALGITTEDTADLLQHLWEEYGSRPTGFWESSND